MTATVSEQEMATLCAVARDAAALAYAPYSRFPVGAAVLGETETYVGANIENASYGLSFCAERAALTAAILAGEKSIRAIAVACVSAAPEQGRSGLMPCGACRQWMAEHAVPSLVVAVCGPGITVEVFTLDEMLPHAFRLESPDPDAT